MDALLDRAEAARQLGVTESWLEAHRDEVPYIRVGRARKYTVALLERYVAKQTVDPLAPSARSKARAR